MTLCPHARSFEENWREYSCDFLLFYVAQRHAKSRLYRRNPKYPLISVNIPDVKQNSPPRPRAGAELLFLILPRTQIGFEFYCNLDVSFNEATNMRQRIQESQISAVCPRTSGSACAFSWTSQYELTDQKYQRQEKKEKCRCNAVANVEKVTWIPAAVQPVGAPMTAKRYRKTADAFALEWRDAWLQSGAFFSLIRLWRCCYQGLIFQRTISIMIPL